MLGHAVGWPLPRGGSQAIVDGMARYLRELGGEIVCGWEVESLDELPQSRRRPAGCDAPATAATGRGEAARQLPAQAGEAIRYGPGVFKIDYALCDARALDRARMPPGRHRPLGGTLAEIAASERAAMPGQAG